MAEIYLAVTRDTDPPRQLAIKVIHQQNAEDPDFVRMLIDEARLAVRLKHPNIVATFDLGREEVQYYLVMEFVDGADLYKVEQRAADQRLSFPIPLCAYIAREVARGLDYAHHMTDSDGQPLHVVHRDISPQNILLSLDGDVKITDFGIAKAARRVEQTQAGVIKGKYYYMSPEQASGQPIDARTDIFALGILLYEMLVGEMLYYDENVERVLQAARKADIPAVSKRRPDTPHELEQVVMRALRRRPEERFASAADMAQALEDFLRSYAPTYGATDLGGFVERLTGSRTRQRSSQEATASMPVREGLFDVSTPSPTVGLPADALDDLGVMDENSLIFRRDGLRELLGQRRGFASRHPKKPVRPERSPRRRSQSGTIDTVSADSPVRTLPRPDPQKRPAPPAEADVTNGVPRRDRHALTPREGSARPSGATPSGPTGDWGQQVKSLAAAASAPPDQIQPSAVYPALVAETEADVLLALASDMRQTPFALPPVGMRSMPGLPPLSSRRTLSETFADESDTAVRPSPMADLIAASARVGDSSAAVPSVELQQSDEAFSSPSVIPVEPKVELTQVDGPVESIEVLGPDTSLDELDPISAETTHEKMEPPTPQAIAEALSRSNLSLPPLSSRPDGRSAQSTKRWIYAISGLGAAALSAVITLYLMGYLGRRPAPPPPDPNLQIAASELDAAAAPQDAGTPPGRAADLALPPPADLATPASGDQGAGEALTGSGRVQLTSEPPGAEVFFEKKLLGVTPILLQGLPTDRDIKLELKLQGFKTTRKRIHWRGKDSLEALVKMRTKDSDSPGEGDAPEAPESGEAGNN